MGIRYTWPQTAPSSGVAAALTHERVNAPYGVVRRNDGGNVTWWNPVITQQTATASAQVSNADRPIIWPFYNLHAGTPDQIGVYCNTSQAGSSVRVGLYAAAGRADGFAPTTVLQQTTIDTTAVGPRSTAISWTLAADTVYWFAFCTNATGTGPSVDMVEPDSMVPTVPLNAATATNIPNFYRGAASSRTSGAAFVDNPITAYSAVLETSLNPNAYVPIIAFRYSI